MKITSLQVTHLQNSATTRPRVVNKAFNTSAVVAVAMITSVVLGGCSVLEPKTKTPDYRASTTLPPLEVPPGLKRRGGKGTLSVPAASAGDSTTLSTYQNQRANTVNTNDVPTQVLPQYDNMRILRSGNQRWLEVSASPTELWPRVTDFWLKDRIRLVTENPGSGVMETDWLENYAEINTVVRRWFRRALGSIVTADSYDKFRVRIEEGVSAGTTEIYMSHRRIDAEELPNQNSNDVISTKWVQGSSDADLEAEMLRLLMMHLGLEESEAQRVVAQQAPARPDRARLDTASGLSRILMDDAPRDAWRRVGIALDRVGFTIEDRDRSTGTYFVRTVDPERAERAAKSNWLTRLVRRGENRDVEFKSLIGVESAGSGSAVTIRQEDGSPNATDAGRRILELLLDELR